MIFAFTGLVIATLVAAASQIVMALLFAVLLGLGPSGAPQAETPSIALACEAGRRIIQIHGTDSTGEFYPTEIARALDPAQPPPEIFEAELNEELDMLLSGADDDCKLTFSYDAYYLPENGVSDRGRNAWNHSTSPWNRSPDELANGLQWLMDWYPDNVTFDIVAYSAGGIVPTYWAARSETTADDRRRVHSIVVVDGIVSGVDLEIVDLACTVPGLRQAEIATYGRFPCQFRAASPFTNTVRTTDWWTKIGFATVRTRGDLIVWHRFAGLLGKTVQDPPLVAELCPVGDWFRAFADCVLLTHGSVLNNETAIDTLAEVIARPP